MRMKTILLLLLLLLSVVDIALANSRATVDVGEKLDTEGIVLTFIGVMFKDHNVNFTWNFLYF